MHTYVGCPRPAHPLIHVCIYIQYIYIWIYWHRRRHFSHSKLCSFVFAMLGKPCVARSVLLCPCLWRCTQYTFLVFVTGCRFHVLSAMPKASVQVDTFSTMSDRTMEAMTIEVSVGVWLTRCSSLSKQQVKQDSVSCGIFCVWQHKHLRVAPHCRQIVIVQSRSYWTCGSHAQVMLFLMWLPI